jgi:hypothetical protein
VPNAQTGAAKYEGSDSDAANRRERGIAAGGYTPKFVGKNRKAPRGRKDIRHDAYNGVEKNEISAATQ